MFYHSYGLTGGFMPDKRTHRGAHPADGRLFATAVIDDLRKAVADFSLLLSKGYAQKSALKLVGDRFSLTGRQRLAVMRSACSDEQLFARIQRRVDISALDGEMLAVDGYNLLITVEAALSGGVILLGRDGCYRDLASIHGTYRKVAETMPAIELVGEFLNETGIRQVLWLLDSPVSNSGRLKTLMDRLAAEHGWPWRAELAVSPDAVLKKTDSIVASSDSVVLDACRRWVNLATEIVKQKIPAADVKKLFCEWQDAT